MKAEITNENKQKFFALYWGQKVIDFGVDKLEVDGKLFRVYELDDCVAELTPLSMISDEDAIEVAKIMHGQEGDFEIVFNAAGVTSVSAYGRPNYAPTIEIGWNGNVSYEMASEVKIAHAIDFLRSRGHAVDWMGVKVEEMVEAGWIKLVEPNKE